ncbi:MAG TPA: hypothetical protein VFH47_03000, partial [Candidatus Thermoplasmatota archaeon]|nr:hypothetical protein [Candidatus Thermoplasmatota archaeon]
MSWVRFGGKLGGAALLLLLATSLGAQAAPADPQAGDLAGYVEAVAEGAGVILSDPGVVTSDPGAVVSPITSPREPDAPGDEPAPREPGFADRVSAAFEDHLLVASAAGVGVALAGMAAFALVGRYVDPKEALENPQRSMLYGFIRGHPGVHLKKLSDEFGMKTSSILWHIRKLEGAQLVRSDRANGYS